MNDLALTSQPQTVGEYNGMVKLATEIISGKEYRRKRRKKIKKTYLKFGSVKVIAYL